LSNLKTISQTDSFSTEANSVAIGLCGLISCRLQLAPDEIHLWQAVLNPQLADSVVHQLTTDELARADRFHFDKDRIHFVAARGLLRYLLSTYTGLLPVAVKLSYAEKGKPSLEESHQSAVRFNLAHSHGLALFAFSHGRELGVDLEYLREELADEKVAERFFSAGEIEALASLPIESRKQAFFNCWTRKEAYIKALGAGLSMPLNEFDVSLKPGEPAALLANHREPLEVERWTMRSVAVPAGYEAAIVVEGRDWQLKTFRLEQGSRE
jgi:4'-phosphopantetheinyl transferase